MKSKVRSVKGKVKHTPRRATPKIASNTKRNKPPMRKRARLDAIPKTQNDKMYEAMKGD